jgi:hypothetical protein
MKTQEFFAQECFTEDVANADKLAIMKSNKLKYDRISVNIFNKENIKVANIVMVECGTQFEEDDPEAYEKLADKIIHEIKNDEYYTSFGRTYHESIINKLIDHVIVDTGIYAPHVQILFNGFKDYLFLAVIEIKKKGIKKDRLVSLKDLLVSKYRSYKFAIHSDYIVVIMSSKYDNFYRKRFFSKNHDFFEENNLYIGVSSCFENLFELSKYYDEAVAALKNGIKSKSDQRIFLHDAKK